jgi:hypothetical protein
MQDKNAKLSNDTTKKADVPEFHLNLDAQSVPGVDEESNNFSQQELSTPEKLVSTKESDGQFLHL